MLNRFLKIHYPSVSIEKFEDLPTNLYEQFLYLCKVAFEGVKNEDVIFNKLSPVLNHFGFLDAVPALYGGGNISYNFLHLTVQEFFAAYHISTLEGSGQGIFKDYSKHERWNVVWRFVAGLTQFKGYKSVDSTLMLQPDSEYSSLFLFQCLFEAQSVENFSFAKAICSVKAYNPTSLDAYALGYCLANFPLGISWKVLIYGIGHHSFTCGLKTNLLPFLTGCPGV